MKVRKAIIPAAGLGTRFLPATKALPKEMMPIIDKPVIQFIVEEAIASGIEDILIITGRGKQAIEDHFDKSVELEAILEARGNVPVLEQIRHIANVNIHYIRQKEPRGLGDAVYQARSFIGHEPFALLLGDDIVEMPAESPPCTNLLIDQFERTGASIIGVQEVPWEHVPRYGIVKTLTAELVPGEASPICDLVEKPSPSQAPSRLAIMGRYILPASIFAHLERTPLGLGGELQLTDALKLACAEEPLMAYHFPGTRYDVGTPLGLITANLMFALRHPQIGSEVARLMEQHLDKTAQLAREAGK
jgi:UTP--glucose-1-phosphate uridylyltransferase